MSADPKETKENRELYRKVAESKKKTLLEAEKGVQNKIKDVVVAKDREFEFAESAGISVEELKAKLTKEPTNTETKKTSEQKSVSVQLKFEF